jgi:hypothetical protein
MKHLTLVSIEIFALMCWAEATASAKEVFSVTYLSAEHVYINGGKSDGLFAGAKLRVTLKDGSQSDLEVVFAAEHSSSCAIVGGRGRVSVGDKAVLVVSAPAEAATAAVAPEDSVHGPALVDTAAVWAPTSSKGPARDATLVSGGISLLLYDWSDNSAANLDFTQTTARLSLKARRLWGQDLNFVLRGRVQYDLRAKTYYEGADQKDWDNRLWEFSLAYGALSGPLNLVAGRILPRRAGAAGYIDGALGEWQFSEKLGVGLFGGGSPDWLSSDSGVSLMKGGAYLFYATGAPDRFRFEQVVGAVGEYHGGEVNREYVVLQGRFGESQGWGVDHTAQIDVNRGWRKEKAGSSVELSNLFVNGWTRIGHRVRLSMSYDNRANVWTYETRSLVDSLFDEGLRQGARAQLELSAGPHTWMSGAFGYHTRSGEPNPTLSCSGTLRQNNVFVTGVSIGLQAAGFDGPFEKGYSYAATLTRTFLRGSMIEGAYGAYSYSATDGTTYRRTQWFELSGQMDFTRSSYGGARIQYESGDDIAGFRSMLEIGYRF